MEYAEERQKRNRIIDAFSFGVLLAIVSAVTLVLFYRQATGEVHSDIKAYMLEMQGMDSGYSFPYPIFFKLGAFIDLFCTPELAVALAVMLLNGFAMVVVKLAMNRVVLSGLGGGGRCMGWRVAVSLASVSLFFVSMLYTPAGIYLPGIYFRYLGVFTPNPFHNATYMAARAFAILAFLWYVKLLSVYEKGVAVGGKRDYLLFSLFLFLATMTKPSFTLVMVSTCGLLMLYRLFAAGFRNLVSTVGLGLCFIPTFLALLYQFKGVFVPEGGEEGGVGFCFGEVWGQYCGCIPLAVCLGVGFPLLVLVCNLREFRKGSLFLFSWMFYVVSFAEAFFLYEKGFRKPDFNFSWGYMYGIFFCHFGALLLLLQVTGRVLQGKAARSGEVVGAGGVSWIKRSVGVWDGFLERNRKWVLAVQWVAYLCHVVCGIFYFKDYFGGMMYY